MVSRRRVLAGTSVVALGGLGAISTVSANAASVTAPTAPPAPPAPVAPRRGQPTPVPRTIARRRVVSGGRLRVVRTDFALSHLGLAWAGGDARVRVRTRNGWTDWHRVDGCDGARDGTPAGRRSAVMAVPDATGYEVSVERHATALVTELDTVHGPVQAMAAASVFGMPLPDGRTCPVTYLSRAAWGADESWRYSWMASRSGRSRTSRCRP